MSDCSFIGRPVHLYSRLALKINGKGSARYELRQDSIGSEAFPERNSHGARQSLRELRYGNELPSHEAVAPGAALSRGIRFSGSESSAFFAGPGHFALR